MFESGVLEHLSSQDDSSRHPSRRLFWLEVVSGYVESNSRLLPEVVFRVTELACRLRLVDTSARVLAVWNPLEGSRAQVSWTPVWPARSSVTLVPAWTRLTPWLEISSQIFVGIVFTL